MKNKQEKIRVQKKRTLRNDTRESLLIELKKLYYLSHLDGDFKYRKSIIDQLILVKNDIIISQDKDLIQIVKNYYLDLPLVLFFVRIKLQMPPILGVIIYIIAAAIIRNAYINQYLIIALILSVILLFGSFIIGYLAFSRENTAQKIVSFSHEAIKVLEEKIRNRERN